MSGKGLDVGTNMLVAGEIVDSKTVFKMERDAFYRLLPKSEVNKHAIKTSLEKRGSNFIVEADAFVVVGEDALQIAIERNDIAKRPMQKGVISPKDKSSLPMLKLLIESLLGVGNDTDDVVIYSVPSTPIDGSFDIIYHTEILNMYFKEMGYRAHPINEAFAIALSELLDEGLTGVTMSFGAGMVNVCVIHQGDPLVEFSLTRSGDFIDQSVGVALDISPSIVQLEKEAGVNLIKPTNKIMEAVAVYYSSVINYTLNNIAFELNNRKKSLPIFKDPVPVIVSGGLTLAEGFVGKIDTAIKNVEFPFAVSEVRRADNPMTCVANGALLASQL